MPVALVIAPMDSGAVLKAYYIRLVQRSAQLLQLKFPKEGKDIQRNKIQPSSCEDTDDQ